MYFEDCGIKLVYWVFEIFDRYDNFMFNEIVQYITYHATLKKSYSNRPATKRYQPGFITYPSLQNSILSYAVYQKVVVY